MKKIYCIFLTLLFLLVDINAQNTKIGRHTVAEWRQIIDTTWGEGQTTSQKLQIFDSFWNAIDQRYAGFEGIEDNWQQLKNWRDTIAQGVSRGRFAGILTQLVQSLHDGHVYMCDEKIASTPMLKDVPLLVPAAINYPSFNWNATEHFGVALTPLADSTLLVYNSVDNHPLGLVPGDIILGYDGRLWKELYKELLQVQFPVSFPLAMACSERAATHQWLGTAGLNWHLFDTIDVVKYATGATVHLPTSLISELMPGIHATEQMPVRGVSFPDVAEKHLVSYGYVEGTKIGYIYVLGWDLPSVDADFLKAVNAFMQADSSDGLIIDFRANEGADNPRWNEGFRRLFNQNFNVIKFLQRASTSNHLTMQEASQLDNWINFSDTDNELYDRPIAVLCGPWTASGGDISVQYLRQHPMVRTFGKPTEGAFGVTLFNDIAGISSTDWFTGLTVAVGYTPPNWNNILNRASIPVDEEIWLTPDGVAKGEDDVVKAALNWMNNLVYGHSLTKNKDYCYPDTDTLKIYALVENPNSHQTLSRIYIRNLADKFVDSLELTKTGLINNSEIWKGNYLIPDSEDFYTLELKALDLTESKSWTTTNISRFTTTGPVMVDSVQVKKIGDLYYARPFVENKSKTTTIKNAKINILCNDPWVNSVTGANLPDIPPNTTVGSSTWSTIHYNDSLFPEYFNLNFEIMSDGWTYWIDSTKVIVTGVEEVPEHPIVFKLEQNYPNPFNPTTCIQYSIASRQFVELKIFNVLGQEIETLINAEKPAGNYQVEFNAANLPSGVYFYRIKAGSFNQVMKMLLIK
jgi:hypothetical protein